MFDIVIRNPNQMDSFAKRNAAAEKNEADVLEQIKKAQTSGARYFPIAGMMMSAASPEEQDGSMAKRSGADDLADISQVGQIGQLIAAKCPVCKHEVQKLIGVNIIADLRPVQCQKCLMKWEVSLEHALISLSKSAVSGPQSTLDLIKVAHRDPRPGAEYI